MVDEIDRNLDAVIREKEEYFRKTSLQTKLRFKKDSRITRMTKNF